MENNNHGAHDGKESHTFSLLDYKNLFMTLVAALIIGLISTIIYQGSRIAVLEEKINLTQDLVKQNTGYSQISENKKEVLQQAIRDVPNPKERLIEFIQEYQTRYVKKSTGTYSYNCFTDNDLEIFYKRNTLNDIEQDLSKNGEFLALVLAIKELSPGQWAEIKSAALLIFKPTYGEVGGPKSDGSAQTEAGQQAERKVGETIVALVSTIKKRDKAEIVEMID